MTNFDFLKSKRIQFANGLSLKEIETIENIYEIKFPLSMKELLFRGVPISEGFYHWHDLSESNIRNIKDAISNPFCYILDNIADIDWLEEKSFLDMDSKIIFAQNELKKAPKLIPLYAHRYIPIIELDDPPILSVHGFDIVCYGRNMFDWIRHEFEHAQYYCELEIHVPFWLEIC